MRPCRRWPTHSPKATLPPQLAPAAAPAAAPIWHPLRAFLISCWYDPRATPEQAALFRGRQFRAVVRLLPLAGVTTLMMIGAALYFFWGVAARPWMLGWAVALAVVSSANAWLGWRWRGKGRNTPVSRLAVWGLAASLGVSALLFALMTVHLFAVGSDAQRVVLVAVVGAVIATGGWMFAGLPQTGLTWSLVLCGATLVGLAWTQWERFAVLPLLLAFYGAALICTVLLTSRLFLQSLIAEQALEQQNQLVGLLLNDFEENASDGLWETDRAGRLRHVSLRLAQIMGQSVHSLQGQVLSDLLLGMAPAAGQAGRGMAAALAAKLAQGAPFRDMAVPVLLAGHNRWCSFTGKPLLDAAGNVAGWRGVASDATALRERDLELNRLANVDALTGLANRHQFNLRLAAQFVTPLPGLIAHAVNATAPRRSPAACALFMLDLDNFKTVNDSLGHAAGDTLLCEVAQRLSSQVRPHALLARLGGDEFALLVPGGLDRAQAQALGDRLQNALMQPCTISGHRVDVHASIGVGFAPVDAADAQSLLKVSDLALYAAKAAGRRTLRFFEPHMDVAARDKLSLLSEFRQALQCGQFVLHYQPQIDLAHNRLLGFEALVRWLHPQRGLVPPAQFIPLAEDSGLIVPLGEWVLRQACADAALWPEPLRVAVNISAVEFERSNVRQAVDAALRASGLPAQRLELELTESTLLQDSSSAVLRLQDVRSIGVRVALDDFGTGFSSLAYLRSFPLDKLKIDRSFVKTLDPAQNGQAPDPGAVAIVQAIHGLAAALGLLTTAEGVETLAQHDVLRGLGCHSGQGHLFARPMDAQRTLAFIETCARQGLAVASAAAVRWAQADADALDDRPRSELQQDAQRIAAGRHGQPAALWVGA